MILAPGPMVTWLMGRLCNSGLLVFWFWFFIRIFWFGDLLPKLTVSDF